MLRWLHVLLLQVSCSACLQKITAMVDKWTNLIAVTDKASFLYHSVEPVIQDKCLVDGAMCALCCLNKVK